MRKASALAVSLASSSLLALSGAALAGDIEVGKAKGDVCLDCHEEDYFAGSSAAEIEALIREGRAGGFEHKDDAIRDLAEEHIADVAAWFAHEGAK
jgi:cytochrome c553